MKPLAILSTLFFTATVASAQTVADQPFKGANVIVITTTDSTEAAWQTFGQTLASNGFAIKNADKNLLTLTTEPLAVGEGGQVVANAVAKGNTIELRGAITVPVVSRNTWPMEYRGSAGNTHMRAWRKLDAAAKAYPSGRVTYAKKD
jgi:dihydrofolate reductase